MDLVIIVLALPFCLPILPGVSAPFGLAIIILALRQMLGRSGRLPGFIGNREFEPATFKKIISGSIRILNRVERFSDSKRNHLPRLAKTRFNLFLIFLMGLLMALPIPFPGTNTFPAWAIVFLATAQAEGFRPIGCVDRRLSNPKTWCLYQLASAVPMQTDHSRTSVRLPGV